MARGWRGALARDEIAAGGGRAPRSHTGKLAAAGLGLTAPGLLAASALDTQLDRPLAACGLLRRAAGGLAPDTAWVKGGAGLTVAGTLPISIF